MSKKFTRTIAVELDEKSLAAIRTEMAQTFAKAAQESGDNVFNGLKGAFDRTMAEAKTKLAAGVIDEKEFKARAAEASRALAGEMQKAKQAGKLTDQEYQKLARTLKTSGTAGKQAFRDMNKSAGILQGTLTKLGGLLGGLFIANKIRQFGMDSLRMGQEVAAGQRQLEQQLRNTGRAWSDVADEVKTTTRALWDTHRLTEGEVTRVLTDLTTITGDYALAIQHVGTVADLAAATNTNQATAAKLLGRVINGETGALKRYGLEVSNVADLQDKIAGRALAAITPMQALGKAWDDLKEQIGLAMMEAGNGTSVFDTLTGAVRGLTDWLARNQNTLNAFARIIIGTVTVAVKGLWYVLKGVGELVSGVLFTGISALITPVAMLAEGYALAASAAAKFVGLFSKDKRADIEAHAASIRQSAQALRDYASAARSTARESFGNIFRPNAAHAQGVPGTAAGGAATASPTAAPAGSGGAASPAASLARPGGTLAPIAQSLVAGIDQVAPIHERAALDVMSVWENALHAIDMEASAAGGIFEQLGNAWAEGGVAGLKKLAQAKVKENIARAAEALARAAALMFTAPHDAAAQVKAAAQHGIAAGLWRAVGGSGGGATGRAGTMGAPRSAGTAVAQQAAPPPPEFKIYIDPLSPSDPRFVRVVAGAQGKADRYFGPQPNVTVHPYPKGGS